MLEGEKVDKQVFRIFFRNNMKPITHSLMTTLNYFMKFDETYLVERDTLVVRNIPDIIKYFQFFRKLIMKQDYKEFRELFLNSRENLKVIMTQLNNDCHKIRIEALTILHEFFVDIDNLDKKLATLILDNKENFYLLFELNNENFNEIYTNFILCELERIDSNL